jgi:hypothetical protein
MEYIGYWITRQAIQLIHNKIEMIAILNIKAPKTSCKCKLRKLVGRSELIVRVH